MARVRCVWFRFAFVEFNTEEEAAAAIEEHNEEEVQGRELQVSYASIGGKSTPQTPESLLTAVCYMSSLVHALSLSLSLSIITAIFQVNQG